MNAPCARCGGATDGRVCAACIGTTYPFATCVAPLQYAWPADHLVTRLKYGEQLAAAKTLGRVLGDAVASDERPDLVLPLPLHPARERRRGFNQAMEIARVAAAALALPVRRGLLARTRATAEQAGLGRRARLRNVRGCFQAASNCSGLHLAVVDDVMTTGATMAAASEALLAAGAARVDAWCVARALGGAENP